MGKHNLTNYDRGKNTNSRGIISHWLSFEDFDVIKSKQKRRLGNLEAFEERLQERQFTFAIENEFYAE